MSNIATVQPIYDGKHANLSKQSIDYIAANLQFLDSLNDHTAVVSAVEQFNYLDKESILRKASELTRAIDN